MATLAYIRVSTDEQAQSGLGLEAQLASIRKAAGEPTAVYADEGYSGGDPKRPALLAALEALRAGDTLVVAKRDRLARDTFLALWIEKEAKRRRARIVSAAGEGTDSDDPAAVLMRTLVDAFAQYERAIIGARTASALKAKRARGEKTGGTVPFGYVLAADGRTLVAEPAEQAVITEVRQMRTDGWTLRAIASELESRGVLTKQGRARWHAEGVAAILRQAA